MEGQFKTGDNIIPTKNWASNLYKIDRGSVLAIYNNSLDEIDEVLILDSATGKQLVVYPSEINVVRTSEDWYKEDTSGTIILDPDGWDRSNYEYSYYEELITLDEYKRRKIRSTVLIDKDFFNRNKLNN